jgi:hypothetical protein
MKDDEVVAHYDRAGDRSPGVMIHILRGGRPPMTDSGGGNVTLNGIYRAARPETSTPISPG